MSKHNIHSGFAIAIAWPETWCKQPGDWYDGIMAFLKFSSNHYYKVGHAAVVLVEKQSGHCYYYDFGRYHTPFKHGRVRSAETDTGLGIKIRAKISDDEKKIENFSDILTSLQLNAECHGEGRIFASYCGINFESANNEAIKLQQKSPLPYGPFTAGGSNCSRFVNSVIAAGNPARSIAIILQYFKPLTPRPIDNVNALGDKVVVEKLLQSEPFCPNPITDKSVLRNTLPMPLKHPEIPDNARWISGEGAGSWFVIDKADSRFFVSRFCPSGNIECQGHFLTDKEGLPDINRPFEVVHLSHCKRIKVQQNNQTISLFRVNN